MDSGWGDSCLPGFSGVVRMMRRTREPPVKVWRILIYFEETVFRIY